MKNFLDQDDYKIEIDENEEEKGLIEDEELLEELSDKKSDDIEVPDLDDDDSSNESTTEEEDDEELAENEKESFVFLNDYGTTDIDDISGEYDELGDYDRDDYWEEDRDGYEGLDIDDLG